MAISAAMVKALREKTDLPMMDCKKALEQAEGDEARAIELLREKAGDKLAKFMDREAGEGRIAVYVDAAAGKAAIVEVRCETAPVASTDDFMALANTIAKQAALLDDATPENIKDQALIDNPGQTLGQYMTDVFNKLRENMQIARIDRIEGHAGHYVHFDGQKGALLGFNAACPEEVGAGVCMHVTAMNPPAMDRSGADPAEVEKARAEYAEAAKGKPPEIAEKIIGGKMDRWYSEFVLLDQPFVKDDKIAVKDALKAVNPDLTVTKMIRYEVGGL